jgi:hypothetical protein
VSASAARVDGLELVLAEEHVLGGVVEDGAGQPLPWAMAYVHAAPAPPRARRSRACAHADAEAASTSAACRVPLEVGALAAGHARFEMPVAEL